MTDAPVTMRRRIVSGGEQVSLRADYSCLADQYPLLDVDPVIIAGIPSDGKHRIGFGRWSRTLNQLNVAVRAGEVVRGDGSDAVVM